MRPHVQLDLLGQPQLVVEQGGQPVAGVSVSIDGWVAPKATDASGTFTYPADATLPMRHTARIVGAAGATLGGRALTGAERTRLMSTGGGISVGYRFSELAAHRGAAGSIVVTGRVTVGSGAPPPVLLYTYLLKGTVTDASGVSTTYVFPGSVERSL